MPEIRLQCPLCQAVVKGAPSSAGKTIKCPKCEGTFKAPATKKVDPEDEDIERDDVDDEEQDVRPAAKKQTRRDKKDRSKKKGGVPLALWIGIGGGVAAVVVVLVIVLTGKGEDQEGGGSDAHSVERRIDTNIPLPKTKDFNLVRYILSVTGSADAGVIAVTSLANPRKYTIDRRTGNVIAEFDGRDIFANPSGTAIVSPSGKLVVFETKGKTIEVRDVANGRVVKTLGNDRFTQFHTAAFSKNGDTLFAIANMSTESVLAGWSVANWQQVCHIKISENRQPWKIFPVTDGKTVVTAGSTFDKTKPQIDVYDVSKQSLTRAFVLPYKSIENPALTPEGKTLAVVGVNGDRKSLDVWNLDIPLGQPAVQVCTVKVEGGLDWPITVFDLDFLPSGKLALATAGYVAAYDPNSGEQKAIWTHNEKVGGRQITAQSICANGEILQVLDGETATILVVCLKE